MAGLFFRGLAAKSSPTTTLGGVKMFQVMVKKDGAYSRDYTGSWELCADAAARMSYSGEVAYVTRCNAEAVTTIARQEQNGKDNGRAQAKYLSQRTKTWLMGLARKHNVRGRSRMNKAQLVQALCS